MYMYMYIIYMHTCIYIYIYYNQYTVYENIHLHSMALSDVFGRSKEGWVVCEEEARMRLTKPILASN
jgi:hypothetical protein